MLKLYITDSNYITEAIDDIKKYYPRIPDDVFMQLIQLDPTYRGNDSAGKYVKWLLNLYNKGNLSNILEEKAIIYKKEFQATGTYFEVEIPSKIYHLFKEYDLDDLVS